MIETKKKEIDGQTYLVSQLDAKTGQRVLVRIFKGIIGPALASVVGGIAIPKGAKLQLQDMLNQEVLSTGLSEIATKLSEADFDYVAEAFAKSTRVVLGEKEVPLATLYETHFAARYVTLLKWMQFCVEVNFGGFFDLWRARSTIEQPPPAEQPAEKAPATT